MHMAQIKQPKWTKMNPNAHTLFSNNKNKPEIAPALPTLVQNRTHRNSMKRRCQEFFCKKNHKKHPTRTTLLRLQYEYAAEWAGLYQFGSFLDTFPA